MIRVIILVLLILLGFLLIYLGLAWLWKTSFSKEQQVEGETVQPETRQSRLVKVAFLLFVMLGAMLVVDRLVNVEEGPVRHYAPATLQEDGSITEGRRY
ncbi:MAG: hypothetical protein G8345_02825 [Magnetococcales bacterium]|nr:hypothetical protein [Magnetococcales bacterium]NGZ25806.1 hypothetical protein [Magnetococcales bacterium]